MSKKDFLYYLLLLFAMLFFSLSFIWYKQSYVYFKPFTVVAFRLVISFPLIFAFAFLTKHLKKIEKKDLLQFAALAFFEPFLYFLGESYGMKYVSATVGSIIIGIVPLITPFIGHLYYKEKLSINNYLGIALSSLGVIVVILADDGDLAASWRGILLMLVAVFATQGYAVALKKLSQKYNALTIVAMQNMIGCFYFLPLFFIVDFPEFEFASIKLAHFKPILYLSVFASTIAFIGLVEGIRYFGLSKATVFTNFIPVFTAVFAYIIISEPLGKAKVAGILITVVGLLMSQANGFPKLRIFGRVK